MHIERLWGILGIFKREIEQEILCRNSSKFRKFWNNSSNMSPWWDSSHPFSILKPKHFNTINYLPAIQRFGQDISSHGLSRNMIRGDFLELNRLWSHGRWGQCVSFTSGALDSLQQLWQTHCPWQEDEVVAPDNPYLPVDDGRKPFPYWQIPQQHTLTQWKTEQHEFKA